MGFSIDEAMKRREDFVDTYFKGDQFSDDCRPEIYISTPARLWQRGLFVKPVGNDLESDWCLFFVLKGQTPRELGLPDEFRGIRVAYTTVPYKPKKTTDSQPDSCILRL